MVAAGSVVAAVQGLHLGTPNSFLSCYRLTRFLSRMIKCDPVSGRPWPTPPTPFTSKSWKELTGELGCPLSPLSFSPQGCYAAPRPVFS